MSDVAGIDGRRHAEERDHHEEAPERERHPVAQQAAPGQPVRAGRRRPSRFAPEWRGPRGGYLLSSHELQSFRYSGWKTADPKSIRSEKNFGTSSDPNDAT
jgi:hypothetical protein